MPAIEASDLLAVGAGCDVTGAFLPARGLIADADAILRRTVVEGLCVRSAEIASQIRDKVDGTIGLLILVTGFLIQATTYAAVADGIGARRPAAAAAFVALAFALGAVVAAFVARAAA